MNKFLAFLLFTLVFSFAAFAAPSWLAINTEAYSLDTTPSENTTSYMAYYCTKEAAQTMFGGSSVEAVTDSIAANFAGGKSALQANDVTQRSANDYAQTIAWDTFGSQYVFTDSFLNTLSVGEYLAVVLYENGGDQAVRVLDNADWTGDGVVFDSQISGSVGEWTTVPEPTSGLLLLLGFAGLALKRKRG